MPFAEVEREYAALKQQFDAGTLTEDQFRARLEELMIEDEQGRWWIVGYETGKWYYNDGEQWVRGDPPRAAAAAPAQTASPAPAPVEPPPAPAEPIAEAAAAEPRPEPVSTIAAGVASMAASSAATPAAPGAGSAVPPQGPPAQPVAQGGRRGGLFGLVGLLAVVVLIGAVILVFMQSRNRNLPKPVPTQLVAVAAATTPTAEETATAAAVAVVSVTPAGPATEAPASPTAVPPSAVPPTATDAATDTPSPVPPTETAVPADTPVPPTPLPKPTATRPRPTAIVAPANPNVVADFETFGTWKIGNQKNGTLTPVSSPVHDGKVAARLDYNIPAGNNSFVVFNASPARAIAGKPAQLRMWVYGDGSGNLLNLWIVDSQGEVQSFPLGEINHTGWQQMTANLDITGVWPQGRVSPTGNGQLDYPIRLAAIVLDGVPDDRASKGTIVLDSLTIAG